MKLFFAQMYPAEIYEGTGVKPKLLHRTGTDRLRVSLSAFGRLFAACRTQAPALLLALWTGAGQTLAWFLGGHECLAVVVLCAFLLVATPSGLRGALAGVLLGVLSALGAILNHSDGEVGEDVSVLARIEDTGRRSTPGRVTFLASHQLREGEPLLHVSAIELPWRNAASLRKGDVVWLRGAAERIEREGVPWSWDGYLWRRGVSTTFRARYVSKPEVEGDPGVLQDARDWVQRRTTELLGERRGGGLFLSMALGYRDVLSSYLEGAITKVGLTHMLVVSGYQVSMVFAVVFVPLAAVARLLAPPVSLRGKVALVALGITALYVMFIGAEVSATRALIAAACLCAEAMVESGRRFSQRIGVALLIVQLLWPWALLEIGVQLTFAALVGIGIGRVLGAGSWLRSFLWVQISVWLATGTIVVAWSGNVSWAALPLNLLVAPVWSAWNCVVGVAAFLLAATRLPLGHEIFELVAWVNELFATGLLRVSETGAGGFEAEGSTRVAVAGIFALGAVAVATQAARKARSFAMISAAR